MASVLVVDDQPLARRAVSALIRSSAGFELVGTAASGAEAISHALRLRPDLVVMDVRMPGLDGVETTRRLMAELPGLRVVLTSTERSSDLPADLLRCGALGFISKQDLTAEALLELVV
jgi:two-component system invasion response regulator UvrY